MHEAELGALDYFRELAMRLNGASHGQRRALVQEAAEFFGFSSAKVYRRLRAAGWRSGRKLREDRGDCRITGDELRLVSNLMVESCRANGKRLLPAHDALEILRAQGKLSADVSPATALRVMRLRGLHPDQIMRPAPHTPLASLHPNHVWQFDVSLCVLFYLGGAGLCAMDEKRFYKNKPHNVERISKQRVWRYLVTDHYSGAFYMEYFLAAGENQETLFHFLMRAFFPRAHEQDPLHGVPLRLVWDAGSANQSFLIRNLLDQLGVQHYAHTPGNPRAKGQVESTHNVIERHFEGRLYMSEIRDLEHLNLEAHQWMRHFNGTREHSRHKHTRYGLWQTIRREQLRLPASPDLCAQILHTKPEPRTVRGALTVSYRVKGFDSYDYSVEQIPNVRVGESIEVCVNPYRAPNINAIVCGADGARAIYELEPIRKDAAGFPVGAPVIGEQYRAAPDTQTDRYRKQMLREAYGVETLAEAEAQRATRAAAFPGIDPFAGLDRHLTHYMRRPGVDLALPDIARPEARRMTRTAALIWLHKLGIPLEANERSAFDAFMAARPAGATEEELRAWLAGSREREQTETAPGIYLVK